MWFIFVIVVSAGFPGISPTHYTTTLIPLSVIIFSTACKELYEDIHRYWDDLIVNHRKSLIYSNGKFRKTSWQKISPGDIIKVFKNNPLPADVLLVASSNTTNQGSNSAFIETSTLDGESNLKERHTDPIFESYIFDQVNNDIIHARFDDTELHIELPNRDLYHFTGYGIADEETFTFNEKQMLLRGSRLKNTTFIIGIVLYTGDKTKVMMNSGSAPIKTSFVQKQLNGFVLNMFFVLITYASIGLYGAVSSIDVLEDAWYIPWELRHPSSCIQFLRLLKMISVLFILRSIF